MIHRASPYSGQNNQEWGQIYSILSVFQPSSDTFRLNLPNSVSVFDPHTRISFRACFKTLEMLQYSRGGSRIFICGGGGAQKIMCAHAHHEREAAPEVPAWPYGRGPGSAYIRALEALGFFDALSCSCCYT